MSYHQYLLKLRQFFLENGDLTTSLYVSSLLAVYDLGASAGQLQKIYADEAISQRPIVLEPKDESILVSKDNWTQYLENQRCVCRMIIKKICSQLRIFFF